MTRKTGTERMPLRWVERVLESLCTCGYFYDSNFCPDVEETDAVVMAAESLGSHFVPDNIDSHRAWIMTHPSVQAPEWRPFDRREPIGWHNDFSTLTERPELSLSWIRREDPSGSWVGAWRVASVRDVLNKLWERSDGRSLMGRLSNETHPFGYMDSKNAIFFPIMHQGRMRFYRRSLMDGARLTFGQVPDHTRETIALIEEAADAVGEILPASRGALLVVHNWFSLHDRTEQTVEGVGGKRRAQLSFVKKLHRPIAVLSNSIITDDGRVGRR